MLLREILKAKGSKVFTVSLDASLWDVIQQLVRHNVGSLVVCDGAEMVGIITERDILKAVAAVEGPLESVQVKSRMSRHVISGAPDEDVNKIMGLMTEKRIRHLPVLEENRLVGLVSIGDVVKAQHDQLTMENQCLINYIQS